MMGSPTFLGRSFSSADNRMFVYEVEGLRQNEQTMNQSYSIRKSSTIQFQVPYSRMNEEMRRISRMGGKIVSIRPVSATEATAENAEG